jgi:heat shock protein HslJ
MIISWRPVMRIVRTTSLLCALAVSLSAGCSGKSGEAAKATQAELVDTYWKITSIDGDKVASADSAAEPHLIFRSEGKAVAGSTGVNRFFGTYELPGGDAVRIRPGGVTRMAGSKRLMDQERRLLERLQVIDAYRIKGDEMKLTAQGRETMVLRGKPITGAGPAATAPAR